MRAHSLYYSFLSSTLLTLLPNAPFPLPYISLLVQLVDWTAGGITEMPKTKITKVTVGDKMVMRIECEPGWKWAECIGPNLPMDPKPEKCPGSHFGYIEKGTFLMKHEDGTEATVTAGQAYECKPGHLAEVVGDEPVVMIEFSQQMSVAYKEVIKDADAE
jgi:hypothetical protein